MKTHKIMLRDLNENAQDEVLDFLNLSRNDLENLDIMPICSILLEEESDLPMYDIREDLMKTGYNPHSKSMSSKGLLLLLLFIIIIILLAFLAGVTF